MEKEKIIARLKQIYKDKSYKYDLITDAKSKDYVTLECLTHGTFKKRLDRLLSGSGCPKCSGKIRKDKDEFINESIGIHGNKYIYTKVEYTNSHTKVCIICPEHGEFWQTPTNHLSGNGCPKCAAEKLSKMFSSNINEFSKKAAIVHHNKFIYGDYYVNSSTPIPIICPIHGEFYQLPHNHLQGKGCPKCNESKLEKEVMNALDENKIDYVYQWHLPWAKKYSLDFFIPSMNMGIECQGIQHFEDGHFKKMTLETIKERDRYKSDSCKEHGIDIIYYSNVEHDCCIDNIDDLIKLIRILQTNG